MFAAVLLIHLMLSVILVVAVLLQSGKGGGLAGAFGGGGATEMVFGGRGAATFLSKLTTTVGALFFVTSFSLAIMSRAGQAGAAPQRAVGEVGQPTPLMPQAQPVPGAEAVPLTPTEGPAPADTAKKP